MGNLFYDLNIPWRPGDPELPRTLAFLHELGYNVVALNHTISGKLPADLSCPIPSPLPFVTPPKLTILRRCTLVLTSPSTNARLAALAAAYDVLAIRPSDERTLQLACTSLPPGAVDLVSVDLAQRMTFHLSAKHTLLAAARDRGLRFEICYAAGIVGDAPARQNVIRNATALVRASARGWEPKRPRREGGKGGKGGSGGPGGRGVIVSSEARDAVAVRAPWDVVNLAEGVWGMGGGRGRDAISEEARKVVAGAAIKRRGYRGVIDVIDGGEAQTKSADKTGTQPQRSEKRKAVEENTNEGPMDNTDRAPPVSKRELKRRQKKARMGEEQQVEQQLQQIDKQVKTAVHGAALSSAPDAGTEPGEESQVDVTMQDIK
ncbi:RNase P subunit p30-domain-containing protein [Lineolata rhizophorae]|uniref:RNase P subunit p30-domain-containing protein n=1 Tax=Lineolata rhizophorae TaxID=578093 RepID=A0A6A6P700_9PEZI|nr:RNase P subunit p30-domain-containing protein [Lineolata rhizophorae]